MPFIKGYRAVRMFNDEDFCVVVGFAAIRALWLFGLWCANAERFGYGALHSDRFAKELEQFDRRCSQALGLLKNRGV
jgi:Ser/Thr protein kinase RdoA (MazF antagonist)